MSEVSRHLPSVPALAALSADQREKLDAYARMLRAFNRKINLVSRESTDDVERVHIPHALALTLRAFPAGATIVDWGTGGGLPAIPLAIALPHLRVFAVDAVEKKTLAVRTMARRLGLTNLHTWAGKAEAWTGEAHYSVSRATAPLLELWHWHVRIARPFSAGANAWTPGLLCLKGGDLSGEIRDLRDGPGSAEKDSARWTISTIPLKGVFDDPYFDAKCIVHVYPSSGD